MLETTRDGSDEFGVEKSAMDELGTGEGEKHHTRKAPVIALVDYYPGFLIRSPPSSTIDPVHSLAWIKCWTILDSGRVIWHHTNILAALQSRTQA